MHEQVVIWGLQAKGLKLLGYGVWIAIPVLGVWRGGTPERIAGAVLLIDFATVALYHDSSELQQVLWRVAAGDVVVLAVLIGLLFRFRRRWLIWAVGVQIVAVAGHLPRLLDPTIRNWGYSFVINALGYALLATLLYGLVVGGSFTDQRRLRVAPRLGAEKRDDDGRRDQD